MVVSYAWSAAALMTRKTHRSTRGIMKNLIPAFLLSFLSIPAMAAPALQGGSFDLYSVPNYESTFCNLGTGLILDRGRFLGEVAVLEDFVKGSCKVGVRPNTRFMKITLARLSCGSRIYQGGFTTADGFVAATITDHRHRLCKDLVPAKIIVSLEPAEGPAVYLYSQDYRAPENPAE